jgi:hypothetical protein
VPGIASEAESPQSFNHERAALRIQEGAFVKPSEKIEGLDGAIAEIANQ